MSTVSVCVPVFNGERYLEQSVAGIMAQTHPLLEIVICDDGSTDDTPLVAASLAARDSRIRVIRGDRSTGRAFSAINWAVRQTSGDFVAVYHADDVYDPTIVEKEARFLEENPSAGAVFCLPRFIDQNGNVTGQLKLPAEIESESLLGCALVTNTMLRYKNVLLSAPSAMLRRSTFDAVGGFDQEYGAQADGEMWLRIVRDGKLGLVHEHLFGYRFHPNQWSRRFHDVRTTREPWFRMMDYHLSQPGVRDGVTAEALDWYRAWEAKDQVERAANALVLGDPVKAVAIAMAAPVKPLLRTAARSMAIRLLLLKALVLAAAKAGGGPALRKIVYAARFRKPMPKNLSPAAEGITWWLGGDTEGDNAPPIGIANDVAKVPRRTTQKPEVSVYIDPFSYHFLGDGLFDLQSKWNRDGSLRVWQVLRTRLASEGFPVHTADYLDVGPRSNAISVYSSFGIHDRYQRFLNRDDVALNSFYLFETVSYAPEMYAMLSKLSHDFTNVYSWSDAESLSPFAKGEFSVRDFRMPAPFNSVIEPHWSRTDRDGVIFVYTNRRGVPVPGELFDERMKALEFFAKRGEANLWGRRWDDLSGLDPRFWGPVTKSWRGPLADKYEAYGRARFVLCYENMTMRGWITEKIFDCFYSGAVPLYLGAPDVGDWIPPECFIDVRAFNSYEELGRFIDTLGPDDLLRYRIAARDYLSSQAFAPFSAETFAERFVADVRAELQERGIAAGFR